MSSGDQQTPEEKHIGIIDSLRLANPLDRKMAYLLIFLFGASSSIMLGVPVMFKDPLIYCTDGTNPPFECSETEACSGGFSYYIDKENGPKSFTTDFELICENSSGKRFALSMNFLGYFVGCFLITFIVLSPKSRKAALGLNCVIYGGCFIFMLFVSESLLAISVLLFISSFCFTCINAYIYVFITENFTGDLASSLMILVNVGWAFAGIFYAILAYFINSDWRYFLGVSGVLIVLGGIYFWSMDFQKNYGNLQGNQVMGFFESIKKMWGTKQIVINFLVYNLIWPLYIVCYTSVLIELESLGGSLYVNLVLCSTIEIFSASLATYLSRHHMGKTIKVLLTLLAIAFSLFFFAPLSLSNSPSYVTILFLVIMLSGKVCYDMICLFVYIYVPKLMTDQFVPLYLIFSRFFSRFLNLFVPFLNYSFKSAGLHPFIFLGLFWIVCRLLFPFTKEVEIEGVDNLMNELKISVAHKLSVMSGGKSMASIPHDELLKNIKAKGQNLSVIRKSKFRSTMMKTGSVSGGLEGTLLKDIALRDYKAKYMEEEENK